jgi:hypothetical protein
VSTSEKRGQHGASGAGARPATGRTTRGLVVPGSGGQRGTGRTAQGRATRPVTGMTSAASRPVSGSRAVLRPGQRREGPCEAGR